MNFKAAFYVRKKLYRWENKNFQRFKANNKQMNSRIILIGIITHAFPTKTEQTGHKENFQRMLREKEFQPKRRETRIFYLKGNHFIFLILQPIFMYFLYIEERKSLLIKGNLLLEIIYEKKL